MGGIGMHAGTHPRPHLGQGGVDFERHECHQHLHAWGGLGCTVRARATTEAAREYAHTKAATPIATVATIALDATSEAGANTIRMGVHREWRPGQLPIRFRIAPTPRNR